MSRFILLAVCFLLSGCTVARNIIQPFDEHRKRQAIEETREIQRQNIDAENLLRISIARKGGCSEEEIKKQLPLISYERGGVFFNSQDPEPHLANQRIKLASMREEVYLMPCFKGMPQ